MSTLAAVANFVILIVLSVVFFCFFTCLFFLYYYYLNKISVNNSKFYYSIKKIESRNKAEISLKNFIKKLKPNNYYDTF